MALTRKRITQCCSRSLRTCARHMPREGVRGCQVAQPSSAARQVYYMHLVDPVPSWFTAVDASAAVRMIPLKIFFEIRDPCAATQSTLRPGPCYLPFL
eukprot:1590124-Prymnesium_polylepis.1